MMPVNNICKILRNRERSNKKFSCNKFSCDKLALTSEPLYKKDLFAHFGCVNAIEFNSNGQWLISGGDDRRVLLWHTQRALHNIEKPVVMKSEHLSNIFCLSFDNTSTHVYSAGNDDQVLLHNIETKKCIDVFKHEQPVYTVSMDPFNDDIFASAGEDGKVLVFDRRVDSSDPFVAAESKSAFHCAMYNPIDSRLIATANCKEGIAVYDTRVNNRELTRYGRKENCMNVRWDQIGRSIITLRRRQPPALYLIDQPTCAARFHHSSYYNSCTMKSCCFAGLKDEYIVSGSDDFNLYMWKIPCIVDLGDAPIDVQDCRILPGHRSIVNQVRFHPESCLIASSGVEKLIKLWSPLPMPHSSRDVYEQTRRRYTHNEYIALLLRTEFMSHDYSAESIEEDPQMMAFFDSLVQRERSNNSDDDSQSCMSGTESLVDNELSSLTDGEEVEEAAINYIGENYDAVDLSSNETRMHRRHNNNNNNSTNANNRSRRPPVANDAKKVTPKHLIDYSDTDTDTDDNNNDEDDDDNGGGSNSINHSVTTHFAVSPSSPSSTTSSSSQSSSTYSPRTTISSSSSSSSTSYDDSSSSSSSSSSSTVSDDSDAEYFSADLPDYGNSILINNRSSSSSSIVGNRRLLKRKRKSKKTIKSKYSRGRYGKRNRQQQTTVVSSNGNDNNICNDIRSRLLPPNGGRGVESIARPFIVAALSAAEEDNNDFNSVKRIEDNRHRQVLLSSDDVMAAIDSGVGLTENEISPVKSSTNFPTFKRNNRRSYRTQSTVRDSSSSSSSDD